MGQGAGKRRGRQQAGAGFEHKHLSVAWETHGEGGSMGVMCHAGSGTRESRKQDPFWAFSSQVCSWCCWTVRIQCLGACWTHTSRWAQTLTCNCRCDRGSFVSLLNTAQLWGKPGPLWVTRFANISLLQDYFMLASDQRYQTASEGRATEMSGIVKFSCCCYRYPQKCSCLKECASTLPSS